MSKRITKKHLQDTIDTLRKDINILVFSPHIMEVSIIKKKYELMKNCENAIMKGDMKSNETKDALNHFGIIYHF
jgi:ABC-type Na+ transport system ATPase subunit NatA